MLRTWKEDVKRGGTVIGKYIQIETQTFEYFKEARECFEQVTTRTLQQWAMAIAFPFLTEDFTFSASKSWVTKFKNKYRIKQRKITRFVSRREHVSFEEILEAAKKFISNTV
ncbi:hypothetical protein RF55_15184 [Lasius niger]|uniref:HTH CENPB-type domain-containing protein n=1 Tax=Lasius niger TaxID=67767 RepID=A0A0J7K6I4_LASNI|nr:hypothetical protein RF55_15184 [Lasius niger]